MILRILNRFASKKLAFPNPSRKFSIMGSDWPTSYKFIWIDCEASKKSIKTKSLKFLCFKQLFAPKMTGLNHEVDTLLEVACIVTDSNLNEMSEGLRVVIHQPKEILEKMNEWCQKTHHKTGLYQACLESKSSIKEAEQQLLTFVRKHTKKGKCYIAGNSVYMDVLFLKKYMPELVNHAHYRLLDVSSLKILSRYIVFEVRAAGYKLRTFTL
ncbi:uncharacterized protein LOC106673027 isoform X2 [Cimex lectularius]|uniref:Exonuclease domain-containing protein n=1 Tax=Cimex lectularius TaxID=79782 RepID=A0A8I6TM99_CIMLE|nr:uncharacterized protein LOC106673027 isoform X2 [Cimex lectularius]